MKTIKDYLSTTEGVCQMWEKINNVLDQFDFEKVHRVMEFLEWEWASGARKDDSIIYEHEEMRIPTVQEMICAARRLLVSAIKDETSWDTGGFRATAKIERSEDEDSPDDFTHSVTVSLEFVLEEIDDFEY